MEIISVREKPEYKDRIIDYISSRWIYVSKIIYSDSIIHSITAANPLPQWYILEKEGQPIGCAGLITNDFISRMDLYPWLCALYIDEEYRGNSFGKLLIEKAKDDTLKSGFYSLYLCTELIGYYEKYGFEYIGDGYHPWNESSRIYKIDL